MQKMPLSAFHFQVFTMQIGSASATFVNLSGSNFMINVKGEWFRPTIQTLVFTKTDRMNMKDGIIFISSNLSQVSVYQWQLIARGKAPLLFDSLKLGILQG
ncbi:hypothetical protein OIU85_000541 [Salix viminalis]|uniref:Uncharacterized protein n=1 Tax=Salix viminalis TaxID=40686 RepID=A0A9Q0ZWV8_SALVM|nr:hypothetical protein OIU85_000541 [Salix viminalis]